MKKRQKIHIKIEGLVEKNMTVRQKSITIPEKTFYENNPENIGMNKLLKYKC